MPVHHFSHIYKDGVAGFFKHRVYKVFAILFHLSEKESSRNNKKTGIISNATNEMNTIYT